MPAVLRRKIQGLFAAQRRGITLSLYPGVERIEPAAGGKADGILRVKLVDRRFIFNNVKWRARSDQRIGPQTAMQIHFAGMGLVITGPLDSAQLLESFVTHAGVHGAQLAQFVPDAFSVGRTPIVPKPASQIEDDLDVVADTRRWRHSTADALHPALAGSHGAITLTPTRGGRKDHVSKLRRFGIEEVLDQKKLESAKKFERMMTVGFRVGGVLAEDVERSQLAALHGAEHPAQVPAALWMD